MRGNLYFNDRDTIATSVKDAVGLFFSKYGYLPKLVSLCERDGFVTTELKAIPLPYTFARSIPSRHFILYSVIDRTPVVFSKRRMPV